MEDLSIDNIVSADVDTLFTDTSELEKPTEHTDEAGASKETSADNKDNKPIEIASDDLFTSDEQSESVDGNEDTQDDENLDFNDDGGSSANFYSSVAVALKGDEVLEHLDDDQIAAIEDADSFKAAIEQEINARLSDAEQRIKSALDYGIEPSEISKYQNTINFLNDITEESLRDESEEGELKRKQLIFQDYINRGFSEQKALKEVDKSINAGTDIDDALEALESNKDFYNQQYQKLLDYAKAQEDARQKLITEKEEALRTSVLDTEEPFAGIKLDKATRSKVLDNIAKPTVKSKDGKYYTKLQDYQMQNPNEFLHKLGVIFTLTDGFKDIDKFIGRKVRQETNKNIRGLERTLKNQRNIGGNPRYVSNGNDNDSSNQNFSRFSLNI